MRRGVPLLLMNHGEIVEKGLMNEWLCAGEKISRALD